MTIKEPHEASLSLLWIIPMLLNSSFDLKALKCEQRWTDYLKYFKIENTLGKFY